MSLFTCLLGYNVYTIATLTVYMLGWHGAVFVRHGVYIEGVFKFDILIPQNFPYGNCPVRISVYSNVIFVLHL